MPASLNDALGALQADGVLNEALAQGMVHDYLVMKDGEQTMLKRMSEADKRAFLIERY